MRVTPMTRLKRIAAVLPAAFVVSGEAARAENPVSFYCVQRDGPNLLLRSDFTDLGAASCTHTLLSSQGATFSETNNMLTNQNSASVDGLVAYDYTKLFPRTSFIRGISIGPYLQADDSYQFQPTGTQLINGYTLTPGAFLEINVKNIIPLPHSGIDTFRIRDGEAFVNTGTRSNSFVFEWIPNYYIADQFHLGQPDWIGRTGIVYTLNPELMVQYDHFDGGPKTQLLFASRFEALRVGPQFAVIFNFDPTFLPPQLQFLQKCSVQLTNHESWEQYTGKEYNWSQASFTYTIPPPTSSPNAPNFGVTASFGYGNSETTGNLTKQVKIGLAAKL
jgi:hypothetical protein